MKTHGLIANLFVLHIFSLLTTKRNSMEMHTDFHTWNQYDPADIIRPEQVYEKTAIFPAHNVLRLLPVDREMKKKLRQHCATLHDIAKQYVK